MLTDEQIKEMPRLFVGELFHLEIAELCARVLEGEAEVRRLNRYDWLKPDAYEKAAAERDALQARVKVLEDALRPFADAIWVWSDVYALQADGIEREELSRARKALEPSLSDLPHKPELSDPAHTLQEPEA